MSKILILGDTHFGVANSSSFFLTQQRRFFTRLFDYMRKQDIKHLLQLGDVYDNRKMIDIRTLKESMEWFVTPLQNSDIDVTLLVGNHDTIYKNTLEPNSVRELLNWTRFHIIDRPTETTIANASFLLVPWICKDNEQECNEALTTSRADYCAGHFHISGMQVIPGTLATTGLQRGVFDRFRHTFSGHFHCHSTSDKITYVGTPYQLTWNDYSMSKGVVVLDTDANEWELVTGLAEDVFIKVTHWQPDIDPTRYQGKILKCYIDDTIDRYEFDKWITEVTALSYRVSVIEHAAVQSVAAIDNELAVKDTLQILNDYIDEVYASETPEKQAAIKTLTHGIYREACDL